MKETWPTDERFDSTWMFQYDGGDQIIIDGKKGRLLAQHPGVLIVSNVPSSTGWAAGVWTYAIQFSMQRVVASEVNAYGGLELPIKGVRARSINLSCRFEFR